MGIQVQILRMHRPRIKPRTSGCQAEGCYDQSKPQFVIVAFLLHAVFLVAGSFSSDRNWISAVEYLNCLSSIIFCCTQLYFPFPQPAFLRRGFDSFWTFWKWLLKEMEMRELVLISEMTLWYMHYVTNLLPVFTVYSKPPPEFPMLMHTFPDALKYH